MPSCASQFPSCLNLMNIVQSSNNLSFILQGEMENAD